MLETIEVANVRCNGCATSIKNALEENGFTQINVDLSCEPRKVTAEIADEAQGAHFKAILRKLGYPLFNEKIGVVNSTSLKAKSFVSCAVGKFNIQNSTDESVS